MKSKLSALPAAYVRLYLGKVITRVEQGKKDFVILRRGKPAAVIIDVQKYLRSTSEKDIKSLIANIIDTEPNLD